MNSPMNAAPMNAAPMNAVPMNAAPMNAAPMNAAPMNAVPMNAAPMISQDVMPMAVPRTMKRKPGKRGIFESSQLDTNEPLDSAGNPIVIGNTYKCKVLTGSKKIRAITVNTIMPSGLSSRKRFSLRGIDTTGKESGFTPSKCTPTPDAEIGLNVVDSPFSRITPFSSGNPFTKANTDALFAPLVVSLTDIVSLQGGTPSSKSSMIGGATLKKAKKPKSSSLLGMRGPMHSEADIKRNIKVCLDLSKKIMDGVKSYTAASALAANATAEAAEAAAVAAAPVNAEASANNSSTFFGGRRRTHRRRRS